MSRHAPPPSEAYFEQRKENRRVSNLAQPSAKSSAGSDDRTVYRDYEVIGRHAIRGVKKGGIVSLPDSPQTDCLIESGHVKLKAAAEKAPVKSAPKKGGLDNG